MAEPDYSGMYIPREEDYRRELEAGLGVARGGYAQAQVGETAAQRQYRAGLTQAQLGLAQGAAARGVDPSQGRAAVYAGGELRTRGASEAAILRAQEITAARQQYMGAQTRAAGTAQSWQDAYFSARLAQKQQQHAEEQAAKEKQDRKAQEAIDAGLKAMEIASMAGGASDVRFKEGSAEAGTREQDAVLGTLMRPHEGRGQEWGAVRGAQDYRAALSDERVKGGRAVPHAPAEDATIEGLRGYEYRYTPEARRELGATVAPAGDRYGIMAQELERTPLGRSMVLDTPQGKMVDARAATTGSLALIGRLGERVEALERSQADRPVGGRRRG